MQLLRYLGELFSQLARGLKRGQRLPPVVVLLIYNGEPRWKGARRFGELVSVPRALRRFHVDFEVLLIDVGAESARRLSRHPTLRGGLLALKVAAVRPARQARVLRDAVRALSQSRSTLEPFVHYLGDVVPEEAQSTLVSALEAARQEESMRTINQYLKSLGRKQVLREGLKRGIERGIERGMERGMEHGLRASLLRVLTRRFRSLPDTYRRRVMTASRTELESWLDLAVTSRSLRKVFAAS